MKLKVRIEGLRECERALARLPKATARSDLRKIGREALEPMASHASALAPERSGVLAFSIAVSEKRTRRARWQDTTRARARYSKGGFRASAATGLTMAMGPAGGLGALNYATHVEFGTVDTAARPYMRPAWDSGAHKALDYIEDNLRAQIDKSTARVAKRRAKVG